MGGAAALDRRLAALGWSRSRAMGVLADRPSAAMELASGGEPPPAEVPPLPFARALWPWVARARRAVADVVGGPLPEGLGDDLLRTLSWAAGPSLQTAWLEPATRAGRPWRRAMDALEGPAMGEVLAALPVLARLLDQRAALWTAATVELLERLDGLGVAFGEVRAVEAPA